MMKEVEKYYNETYEAEWERLDRHRIEFDITRRYMTEYLEQRQTILDVGAGPGKYALFLAGQGHQVTLLDLSSASIELARQKAALEKVELMEFIHGNALELSDLVASPFDVVLCMGPLYHLTEEEDRIKVVTECLSKLKPGGLLFASFISAYAPIVDYIKNYPGDIVGKEEMLLNFLTDGRNIPVPEYPGFTTAYFINPRDIEKFMGNFGLEKIVITGVEGLPAQSEAKINALPKEAYEKWLDIIYKTSTDPLTWASCEHFLYIGRKA